MLETSQEDHLANTDHHCGVTSHLTSHLTWVEMGQLVTTPIPGWPGQLSHNTTYIITSDLAIVLVHFIQHLCN